MIQLNNLAAIFTLLVIIFAFFILARSALRGLESRPFTKVPAPPARNKRSCCNFSESADAFVSQITIKTGEVENGVKNEVQEAALIVLRGLTDGIESGKFEAVSVNVENVPYQYPAGHGGFDYVPSAETTVIIRTVEA